MKKILILILTILTASCIESAYASHHIRTTDINSICNTQTDTVRNVPERVKAEVYKDAGVPNGNHTGFCGTAPRGCEVDHEVSLELGGSNHISNLQLQTYDRKVSCNAVDKDNLENLLHDMICKTHTIDVVTAQNIIYNDWKSAYKKYVNPNGCER